LSPERKRFLLGLARQGEAWVATMQALGIPARQEAEFYRVCAAFERAKALMAANEWPPLGHWVDDILVNIVRSMRPSLSRISPRTS
jgi:hypothetical protein